MITTSFLDGIIEIYIRTAVYGQAGMHWRDVLEGNNHNGYGRIYIQRFGAKQRRYWHCYGLRDYYKGELGSNLDECPGAMFIWETLKEADVEAVDAIDNQKLGRELGNALAEYKQHSELDLWEVKFIFI